MIKRDVVVVGAGPAGLISAREAAKSGIEVTVLEEHKEIGIPCHCAGLMSIKGLRRLQIPLNSRFVQNKVKGAIFHSPSGLSFSVEKEESVACVVNRSMFDKFLMKQAISSGAEIKLNSKVQQLKCHKQRILVNSTRDLISANIVVNAEGISSFFVKRMGLTPINYDYVLPAFQFELNDVDVNSEFVEIYVGKKIAPSFFAWVIPLSSKSARVGLACKEANPRKKLESFIQNRFESFNYVSSNSGRVITCGPIPKTFNNNFVVVGDAAGQVKPTTGGGVILGGICSTIASRVITESIKKNAATLNFLEKYENLWKRKLEREFKVMRLARRIFNHLSDDIIDKFFKIVKDNNFQKELSIYGDIDFQASLLTTFIKKRFFLKPFFTYIKKNMYKVRKHA
jgi:geranylgeranyl reductase family protein